MGVPGLPPSAVGVKAEIEALQKGIASLYPDINGLPALKEEASRFIKAFINGRFGNRKVVYLLPVPCKAPLLRSSLAVSVMKRKIRYCLLTRDFLYRSNS